ncbi:filamentous hemagglutinin N-terminal domain-containing protein [Pseudomonas multiresinivorans]|uniref:two-partner secretion domain-containing protein n=1 Tax=Pseudomonas multiresinivorans TaxID=95301 RepID=UPI001F1131DC|nr:filamentous hemagglutinin N-terminal domain-containing protein [Pseudomonas multiresinivorans]
MDIRHPLYQAIASVLAGILILNPIVAAAAELAVDAAAGSNTHLGAAGNGVPVVNIATPNGAGLSHNKFTDYNVGQNGLILNNATGKTQATQLGGIIVGNPNLKGGAAQKILNEVTGANSSQLRGYTEVAGQSAHVIVANPHGITCNGCGFINTPRATLTTGKPLMDGERLRGYDVDGGEIAIEGAGLNASNLDQFELITRSAKLNADLYAKQLAVVTGRNQVDAETLAATAKADDGSAKPQLAIDSSALGGMYAGAIRLVGTEQGVGVKLAGNMAASGGDIQIDANGQLSLAQTSAAGSLRAKASDIALNGQTYAAGVAELSATGQLSNSQSLAAGQRVALSAAQVSNSGIVEAGVNPDNSRNAQGDVAITAQSLRNSGSVVASRNLEANASGTLDNQGGALKGADTRVTAATLDNRQGRLLAGNQLTLSAASLDNRNGQAVANRLQVSGGALDNRLGLFSAEQALDFTLDNLDNSGKGNLVSNGTLQARVQQKLDNQADGLLSAKGALGVHAGTLDNRGGLVVGDAGVTFSGASLNNSALGVISSLGELKLDIGQLDNSQGGALDSGAALYLTAGQVDNDKGSVSAKGDLQAKADRFSQQGGELLAQGALNLEAGQLDNRNGGLIAANNGVTLKGTDLLNQGGEISSRAKVDVQAASLENGAGKVIGDAGLNLQVQRIANRAGTLAGRDGLTVTGQSLDNQGGLLNSQKNLWLQLAGALDNSGNGALLSQGTLTLNAGSLDNRAGTVSSAGQLFSRLAGALNNQGGKLLSDATIDLAGADLNNAGGILSAAGDISLQGTRLDNSQKGRIVTDAAIHLATAQLDNSQGGSLSARGVIDGRVTGLDQHGGGQLIGQAGIDLDLQGGALNNAGGLLGSPGQLVLRNVASLDNRGGEISSDRAFALTTGTLLNQGGKVLSSDRLTLTTGALNNSGAGVLSGNNGLTVNAASLDNSQGGTLASRSDLLLRSQGALDNHGDGALVAGGQLDVGSASLNNQGGLLSASGNLLLATGTTDNRDGRLLAQGRLDGTTADLDNRDGVISGAQGLDLGAGNVLNDASATGKPGGLITSQGALTLRGGKLESTAGGEISAKGDLHLIVTQLIQQQAALIGEGKVTLDLGNGVLRGDFDNRGGLLSAGGLLAINGLGSLDNRGGEISASQGFALTASGTLDNRDQGRIISAGQLDLNANTLRNANQGLFSGWQGLAVNAASLDNSSGGTLSSRDGALTLTLSGNLDNHNEGALVSKGKLSLGAGSLNNAGGIVSTQGDLGLALSGNLDNSAAGLLSTQGSLTGSAKAVANRGGQISAASVDYDASSLDNSSGSLVSQGALRLGLLGTLLNNGADSKIASGGPLNLNIGSLQNHGGQLASQGLLKVLAGSFDNSAGGTVAAQTDLTLTLTGELLNGQDGLIFAKTGQLNVSASRIDNSAGTLQGQGDTTLKATGAIGNQGGHIISQSGQLDLGSASLDNSSGGVLNAADGSLKLVTGTFSNNAGTTQAKGLDITATGGIDNRTGHLSAVSGDNRISTTDLNNQGGGLYAGGLLYLRGNQLLNDGAALGQGGKIGAGSVDASLTGALNNQFGLIESSGNLTLGAASINNVVGSIRALGQAPGSLLLAASPTQMNITSGGLFNNNLGRIESATQDLILQTGALQNGGGNVLHVGTGTFGIDLAQAGQAGGNFTSNGSLTYQADNWTNNAVIQARNLNLTIGQLNQGLYGQLLAAQSLIGRGGDWTNSGLIASDGTLDLDLSGNYTADGRVSSLGSLSLDAGYIGIGLSGSIGGGGATTVINSNGTLDNGGRLTATQDLRVSAASLNNRGTLGSAGNLYLGAGSLLNENGLIFSGGNMQLRTQNFTNRNADLYSLGTLHIAANDQEGWASSVQNISGSFESGGAMTLLVQDFDNRRADDFQIGERIVAGNFRMYADDVCDGKGCEFKFQSWERYEDIILKDAPQASITAGGDFRFRGGSFDNLYSSIASGRNIDIQTATFRNQGAAGGEERHLDGSFYSRDDNLYWAVRNNKDLYNRYNDPNSPDYSPGALTRLQILESGGYPEGKAFRSMTESVIPVSGTPAASAVIQATGDVVINASQSFDNSVVKRDAGVQTISPRDVGVANGATTVQLAITSQLPPDLAQKQVNPVTLPGFSLPQGENGLFRLSGQGGSGGSTGTVQGAGDLSFNGQTISAAQREQSLGGGTAGAGNVALGNSAASTDAESGAALNVPRVQGLPSSATPSNSHKYLVETNPELTSLKSFLGSDYLLGLLGYDPDKAQKRLGDGLYEQRLIQQAVVARTGQRYIDGMASDEALFKYLMDNAIAYKDSLQLQLGVGLSAEQVAALTHDIVWLEEATINGEKVLVPVLYLAQAEGRLAANGALIMGNDLSLISGGNLTNQGTLRASGDLAASAANINNSGLIEAGNRLDLLAIDSIRNAAGGIISGRDVSLTALTGDVINERSITSVDASNDAHRIHKEISNNAARIEARGDLEITAGRDLISAGSVLQAGGNASLTAGRDLRLEAAQEVDSFDFQSRRITGNVTSVTQHGSDVQVGGNLELNAGRDLSAVASRIDAARDIAMSAGRDVVLASAANEEHSDAKYKGGGKKVTTQEDHVGQQATEVIAGGDVLISAGENLTLVSSKIGAGNEAYLVAGDKIELLAANDSDYSLYDMEEKGSWGKKKTQRDEVTDVRAVGSEISAGSDITLLSGGDQKYQGAKLEAGNDIAILSGGEVTFEAVKDLHQESHAKSDSDLAWTSSKGEGKTDETLRQTQMIAQGNIAIKAVDGLKIDYKHIDQKSVSQAIDAMVQANPSLGWLKEAEARGDVDWRAVKEIHDSYKYSNSGLGAAPQLIIAIVASYFLGPLYGAMASNLAVGTINNGGDIGQGLEYATTSDALKSYAMAGVGEYVISPKLDSYFKVSTDTANQVTKGFDLSTWAGEKGIGAFAAYNSAQALSQAVMQQAAFGGSFADNLMDAFSTQAGNLGMAVGFNGVGDWAAGQYGGNVYRDGSLQKIVAHALMGGLLAEATGSDFKTGAMAAGVNEALANVLHGWAKGDPKFELMESQIVGVLAAAAVNGDVGKGAEIAKNATAYNRQLHPEEQRQIREKAKELEAQYGKIDLGSLTWEDMLTLSAGTAVDKTQSEQYLSLLKQLDGLNPDSSLRANFDHISEIAFNSVSTMGMGSEPLRWANGEPIIAHGQPVYAFQATAEQFADSNLFNQPYLGNQSSAAWANLQRALAQYGSDQTGTHNGEIGSFKGQIDQQQYIREALGLAVGDGILISTPEDYLIPAGGAAKGAATATGKLVKGFGEALASKIEAKLAESAVANTVAKGTAVVPRQGTITFESGKTLEGLSASEQQGLKAIQNLGYDVHVPLEASKKGISGVPTSEFQVQGLGKIDVYKPEQLKPTTIAREIEVKVVSGQADSVVVVVPETFSKFDMYKSAAMAFGKIKGGQPIPLNQVIFSQGEKTIQLDKSAVNSLLGR